MTSLISVVKQLPVRLGLFADENKDASGQRYDVEKEDADVLCDFHDLQFTTKDTKITK